MLRWFWHWWRKPEEQPEQLPAGCRFVSADELAAAAVTALNADKPTLVISPPVSVETVIPISEEALIEPEQVTPDESPVRSEVKLEKLTADAPDELMAKCAELSAATGNITFGTRAPDGTIKIFELR